MSYANSLTSSMKQFPRPSYNLADNNNNNITYNYSNCNENSAVTGNSVSNMMMNCNSFDSALLQPHRTPIRTRSGINSKQISRTHSFVGDRSKNTNHSFSTEEKQNLNTTSCHSYHNDQHPALLENSAEINAENVFLWTERAAAAAAAAVATTKDKTSKVPVSSGPSATKDAKTRFIYAIDHLSTKLQIPMSVVKPTLAMEDDGLVPGLCRLYMEGRCRQGERCYQVHADPVVIKQLRLLAHQAPSCCHVHGAECNYEDFPPGLTVTIESVKDRDGLISYEEWYRQRGLPNYCSMSEICENSTSELSIHSKSNADNEAQNTTPLTPLSVADDKSILVPLTSLNPTSFLWKLYRDNGTIHLQTTSARVCREHRKGLCKFGDECNFLHVCRAIQLESADTCPNLSRNASINNFSRHWSENATRDNTPRQRFDSLRISTEPYVLSRTRSLQFNGNVSAIAHSNTSARQRGTQKLLAPSNSMPDMHFCNANYASNSYACFAHNKSFSKAQDNSARDNICNANIVSNGVRLDSRTNQKIEFCNMQYPYSNNTAESQPVYPTAFFSSKQELLHAFAANTTVNYDSFNGSEKSRAIVVNGKRNSITNVAAADSNSNSNNINNNKNKNITVDTTNYVDPNFASVTPTVENEMYVTNSNNTTVVNSNIHGASSDFISSLAKQHSMSDNSKNYVHANNNSFANNFSLAASTANSFVGFVEINNTNSAYSDNNYTDNNIEQDNYNRLLCPLSSHSPTPVSTPLMQKSFSHNPYGEPRSSN